MKAKLVERYYNTRNSDYFVLQYPELKGLGPSTALFSRKSLQPPRPGTSSALSIFVQSNAGATENSGASMSELVEQWAANATADTLRYVEAQEHNAPFSAPDKYINREV